MSASELFKVGGVWRSLILVSDLQVECSQTTVPSISIAEVPLPKAHSAAGSCFVVDVETEMSVDNFIEDHSHTILALRCTFPEAQQVALDERQAQAVAFEGSSSSVDDCYSSIDYVVGGDWTLLSACAEDNVPPPQTRTTWTIAIHEMPLTRTTKTNAKKSKK